MRDAIVNTLVQATLLISVQKRATRIRMSMNDGALVVQFEIDGVLFEEMRSPPPLGDAVFKRLQEMSPDGFVRLANANTGDRHMFSVAFSDEATSRIADIRHVPEPTPN